METREAQEQRIIDHEARVCRQQANLEGVLAARAARRENRTRWDEARWFRRQYLAMLRGCASERDLRGLGLTDEVIREAGLGDSVAGAWRRYAPASPQRLP